MNKFETACFIIGCIGTVFFAGEKVEDFPNSLANIFSCLIFAAMIILPLFFNFWR